MELKVTGPVLTIYSLNLSFKKRNMFQILHLFPFSVVHGEDSQITNLSLMQIISNIYIYIEVDTAFSESLLIAQAVFLKLPNIFLVDLYNTSSEFQRLVSPFRFNIFKPYIQSTSVAGNFWNAKPPVFAPLKCRVRALFCNIHKVPPLQYAWWLEEMKNLPYIVI